MNENFENNSFLTKENLIGILLVTPIYIVIFDILNLNGVFDSILFPILMYLPMIIGIFLSYKMYNDKINKSIGICVLFFMFLTIFCFYDTFFIEHKGWDGLTPGLLMYINAIICRIVAIAFFGKIVGWKKALIFFGVSYGFLALLLLIYGLTLSNSLA